MRDEVRVVLPKRWCVTFKGYVYSPPHCFHWAFDGSTSWINVVRRINSPEMIIYLALGKSGWRKLRLSWECRGEQSEALYARAFSQHCRRRPEQEGEGGPRARVPETR